ncbi:TetR/AcrR family transcriptional regulator [uncultured Dokdonia sp.]|uniref:TetR/AcrR family transcriptional regulator n=1 Tax=Dokdonia sp. R78006 TaxID=3093866 RepID=UPI00261DAF94|nr:TetR/AcrR family transcriptional regulator [uncultured Dokdonia sp.]
MKHAEVKSRIIETASNLFYKNGYNATGINQIIAEAGIAKATLYNHFKSKEEICLAYLKHKNVSFLEDFEAFTTSKKQGKEQLLAIFDFLTLFYQQKDFNGCWCIKTVSEIPKDNKIIRDEIQLQKNTFIALITKLVAANIEGINKPQTASLARQIYLLYESAVGESHLHQEDWPILESKNICERLIT